MKIRPFETEALRFFSAGSVPSLPGVPAVQAVRPLHGCFLLPVSQQYPQIPQIISRAPGQDRVTQPRKKRKCIASLKEISRIESRLLRTLERPPFATAPAPELLPSIPSVPALSTATFSPAIFSTQASTNAEFLPPIPFPVTGELTSPSAIKATRRPRCITRNSASCLSNASAAFSTGHSSVELSQHVTKPNASAAWCAG